MLNIDSFWADAIMQYYRRFSKKKINLYGKKKSFLNKNDNARASKELRKQKWKKTKTKTKTAEFENHTNNYAETR